MPTISGSTTTYITRGTVVDYCDEQDSYAQVAEFARLFLEAGASVLVGAIIKRHPAVIMAAFETLYDSVTFLTEVKDVMESETDALERAVRDLAASTDPNAKIKVVTTYSEWVSGSGNHSCNYQVSNTYNVV